MRVIVHCCEEALNMPTVLLVHLEVALKRRPSRAHAARIAGLCDVRADLDDVNYVFDELVECCLDALAQTKSSLWLMLF